MDIEIEKVNKKLINDKLEYYYYLSPNEKENNITDWVKVKEEQDVNSDKLVFQINTKDISNYDEVSKSEKLYLYIKEVAIKDGKEKEFITNSMKIGEAEKSETYVNEIIKEDEPSNPEKDPTTSKEKLPYTGKQILIIFMIISFTVGGIILFLKYRTIDK